MEFLSGPWLVALGTIILIDLVLAGDNAIVIALAARNLPPELQKKAIMWGTVGAIVVRSVMTLAVVWLLKIPGLMLIGGLALFYIAVKLVLPEEADESGHVGATTLAGAMKTIIIADAVMGVDNVLGVAGAAKGDMTLVVLGLLISIPIVVWASNFVLKMMDRYPVIIYIGAGVLALTGAGMIAKEPFIQEWIKANGYNSLVYAWYAITVGLTLWVGKLLAGRIDARRALALAANAKGQQPGNH